MTPALARRRGLGAGTVLVVLALATAGCDDDRRAISRDDLADVDTEPERTLVVDDDGFRPAAIEVEVGTLLAVTNEGGDVHDVRSEPFDTGQLEPGDVTYVVVSEIGRFTVTDRRNPEATATLTVTDAGDGSD